MTGNRSPRPEGLDSRGGIGRMGGSLRDIGGSGLEGHIENTEDLGPYGTSGETEDLGLDGTSRET